MIFAFVQESEERVGEIYPISVNNSFLEKLEKNHSALGFYGGKLCGIIEGDVKERLYELKRENAPNLDIFYIHEDKYVN